MPLITSLNFQNSFMSWVLLLFHSTDEETVLERGVTHSEVEKNPTLRWFAEMGRIYRRHIEMGKWGLTLPIG